MSRRRIRVATRHPDAPRPGVPAGFRPVTINGRQLIVPRDMGLKEILFQLARDLPSWLKLPWRVRPEALRNVRVVEPEVATEFTRAAFGRDWETATETEIIKDIEDTYDALVALNGGQK